MGIRQSEQRGGGPVTKQDWIDFMSEPEPFDHDDYADADDFYTRRLLEKRNPDCLARYGEDIFGDGK